MTEQLSTSMKNGKMANLNKQIIEIKKKINLSEGQRKANFEECDVKKRENAERLAWMKKELKELRMEFARAKNNDESAEYAMLLSHNTSACMKKQDLNEAIENVNEDIVRYRKELDLIRYRVQKQKNKLTILLREYEELMNDEGRKMIKKKQEVPLNKKIVRLENELLRINVMQMEAGIIQKKYKSVQASLKKDTELYASKLQELADEIKEQNNEIERLKKIKEEAITLKNSTREELTKLETEIEIVRQQQENLIQDYRKQVEERKIELESLERMGPPINRQLLKYEVNDDEDSESKNVPQNQVFELEEIFIKLRNATGVTKTDNVLQRFLNQQATKERLDQMQHTAEKEKMQLEKRRQLLTAEIEMRKFSESKDADENAEKLQNLTSQIEEQKKLQENAELKKKKQEDLVKNVTQSIRNLCRKCMEMNDTNIFDEYVNLEDPDKLLKLFTNGVKQLFDNYKVLKKSIDMTDTAMTKKLEVISTGNISIEEAFVEQIERPLFPMFPVMTTPGGQQQPSEDEEEIPSRSILKRQAQLLVDAKSRRKCFNFKR